MSAVWGCTILEATTPIGFWRRRAIAPSHRAAIRKYNGRHDCRRVPTPPPRTRGRASASVSAIEAVEPRFRRRACGAAGAAAVVGLRGASAARGGDRGGARARREDPAAGFLARTD